MIVDFSVRLKLKGNNVRDQVILPCSLEELNEFLRINEAIFSERESGIVKKLLLESQRNENIKIEIRANH